MVLSNKKPLVLLIHGLRGSHHGFSYIEKYLEEHFEVINADIPGSGEAKELAPHTLDSYIEYYHRMVTSLPTKPIVVAHSMGTIIASHYVDRYPEDVAEKVVLMSPTVRSRGERRTSKVAYGVLYGVLAPFPRGAKKKIMASRQVSFVISHFLTHDKAKQKWIDEEHYKYSGRFSSAKSLMADIKMSMTTMTVIPREKKTLVIMGKEDKLIKAGKVKMMAEKEGAKYCEVEGTGHLINYEKPEVAGKLIYEFLTTEE